MPRASTKPSAPRKPATKVEQPQYGLVCITFSNECRYRTTTRAAYLALPDDAARRALLERIYWENISRFHNALSYCDRHDIRLYRVTSSLFPMSDEPIGDAVLRGYGALLSSIGRRAERLKIRIVIHPDQFVVLSSDTPKVVQTSVMILEKHALAFDLIGLPRSPWAAMIIHGGKADRAERLLETISQLSPAVRSRLCLENDEYSYSATDILRICRAANVPMVFDNLHHAIKEQLDSYDHPSIRRLTRAACATWPRPGWQLVHLSNGNTAFRDRNHSQLITDLPAAYSDVPWIEVEARGKEQAINDLRARRK
ncbi:MAG TPA: UV DNA damage repair endonuclease UvsE [Tepidisphaeraceae bacterium]|jgi:UV DNA damage endonuclease|nr:UV DNA damage repair endonuclease UvsE [Tepidisphaeraceae bacterium]